MTNSKLTYTAALTYAIDLLTKMEADADEMITAKEVAEKLTKLREQTEKRNSAENHKPTKAQRENAELSEVVAEVLTDAGKPLTVTEIMKADPRFAGLSNQKVTAVLRAMGDRVVKVPDKRVNRFQLA